MSHTTTFCLLANVMLVLGGCAHSTLERKVVLPAKPNVVKGSGRVGTFSIDKVTFEPKASSGVGKDIWRRDSVQQVEQALRQDLSAQPWLGAAREVDGDWRLQMSCKYQATMDNSSYWLWSIPIAGVGLMGGGGALISKGSENSGQTLLIIGALASLVGGIVATKPLFEPPAVTEQTLTCEPKVKDRFNRDVFSGEFRSSSDEGETFEPFFVKAEGEILSELRDSLEKTTSTARSASVDRGLGSIAVMDLDVGSFLDQSQRSLVAKLIASELQGLGVKRVLGVDDVKAVLGYEKQRQLMGCTDDSCVAQFGNMLGVDRIVAGSVGQIGSTYIIELRLINVTKFGVDARTSKRANTIETLIDVIPQVAKDLILF